MIHEKKILFMTPFARWPRLHGAIVRSHYLAKCLAEHNQVWYVHRGGSTAARAIPEGSPGAGYVPVSTAKSRLSQLFSLGTLLRLRRLVQAEGIDLLIASHLWSGVMGVLLKWLTGTRLIFDDHNVETLRFRRIGNPLWPLVRLGESAVCRSADKVICVSDWDRAELHRRFNLPEGKIQVLPNGADVRVLMSYRADVQKIRSDLGIAPQERLVLFFGSLTYPPNQAAVDDIMNELCPRLRQRDFDFKVVVAGPGGLEYQVARNINDPGVLFTGYVEEIHSLVVSADVVIAPLSSGSGTRLKIIETIACGKPIVSTSLGAEGLDREVMGDLLKISDDWQNFADCMIQVTSEKSTATPSEAFIQMYDWQAIADRMQPD